jgi:hypothetical protein
MTNEEVNQFIDQMLNECDGKESPTLCRRKLTEADRNYIKSRIVHLVTREGVPIESTLSHIEQELQGL